MSGFDYYITYEDENSIKNLLLYRKVVKVDGYTMVLDNGTKLTVLPNSGCCCGAGCYDLEVLNEVNNTIMDVEFCDFSIDNEYYEDGHSYRIFVYANGIGEQELLRVDGDDGNGYYGTGYDLGVVINDGE